MKALLEEARTSMVELASSASNEASMKSAYDERVALLQASEATARAQLDESQANVEEMKVGASWVLWGLCCSAA